METIQTAEVIEISLDSKIENTLVKHNVTKAVIAVLKEKYGNLRLKSLTDKESYLEIKEAYREVRKVGILAEKLCKEGRAEANKIQKKWLAKEDEVTGELAVILDPLGLEIKKFDEEKARIDAEEEKKRQEAYMTRQQALMKMGASYSDGSFVLNHISYGTTLIKDADDEMWNMIIMPKYRKEYEKLEAEKAEQERIREEEAARLKKEREEFDRQQREFKEQQETFRKQQEEAQRQQREAEQKAVDGKRKKDRETVDARINQLLSLGFSFDFKANAYVYENLNVHNQQAVHSYTDAEWDEYITKIIPEVVEAKKIASAKAEEKRLSDLKEAQEAAVKAERDRAEREQQEIELKKQLEAQKKAEELAKSNDKTKWEHFISQINAISLPEMKSRFYRSKIGMVREKWNEIKSL